MLEQKIGTVVVTGNRCFHFHLLSCGASTTTPGHRRDLFDQFTQDKLCRSAPPRTVNPVN